MGSLESLQSKMADKDPEELQEEKKEPVASTSKDYDGKFRLSRSVSCSKVENEPGKPEENQRSNSKKRKDPPSPPKVSIKDTKAKFEDIQEKYRNQRNQKDVVKEKAKFKRNCKKTPTEVVEDPIAKMLKKMMEDLKEIKTDVKANNSKIDGLTDKVNNLENKHKNIEESNENQFKELREEIVNVEEKVTTKLMSEITPSLESMRNELQTAASQDLRRIVQEEVELMRLREAKENTKTVRESGDEGDKEVDPEKNKKSKKNIKES